MTGRKQDCVWLYFDKTKVVGKAACLATCKKCGQNGQGLVIKINFQNFNLIYINYMIFFKNNHDFFPVLLKSGYVIQLAV